VTANQVTIARIALLPVPCAMLLFAADTWRWPAFFLLVFLGMTDFIDGLLARRDGPTKLGSLLDPVADKMMIAAITLSLSGNGWVPVWVPVSILLREFFITALRSSVALRGQSVKTSILAKLKTIIQMGGFGTVFMTIFLQPHHAMWVAFGLMMGFWAIWAYWLFWRKQSAPYWAIPVALSFFYWLILLGTSLPQNVVIGLCLVIVGITWLSAGDYLWTSAAIFRLQKPKANDIARLVWVIAHGAFVVAAASLNPLLIIPVLLSVSFELALGGIDNIVISEGRALSYQMFLISGTGALLFVFFQTAWMAAVMVVISIAVCLWAARSVQWRYCPEQ
jgi:CDP-diacylglycerol--glycerol-3-phosphate 3-phosphatidyltransferase